MAKARKVYFNMERVAVGTSDDFIGDYWGSEWLRIPEGLQVVGQSFDSLKEIERATLQAEMEAKYRAPATPIAEEIPAGAVVYEWDIVEEATGESLGEGPFKTEEDAQAYIDAEVGVAARVVKLAEPVVWEPAADSLCVDCDRGQRAHMYAGNLWHWYESLAGANPVCYRRPCYNAAE